MSTWRTRFIAILFCAASRSAIDYRAAAGGSVAWNAADGGWLLLEGCGNLAGTDIAKRFVALAGGPARSYVVISTAISNSEFTPDRLARCGSRTAQILGVAKVICLDARDHDEANSARFNAILRKADAVWIYGGDEERLVDRYVGTATVASLRAVLDRGGVLGGTSAGAMILASFVPVRATLPVSAFGFIPNTTIAPTTRSVTTSTSCAATCSPTFELRYRQPQIAIGSSVQLTVLPLSWIRRSSSAGGSGFTSTK